MVESLQRDFKMEIQSKSPEISGFKIKILFVFLGISLLGMPFLGLNLQKIKANLALDEFPSQNKLVILEKNTLVPVSDLTAPEPKIVKKLAVVVTAYSSTQDQTDSEPFITAAGTSVRDGVVANNWYPFSTKIRFPEIYGDKVFVVEDRMNWKKGNYHFDIWFSSYEEAKNFGTKIIEADILED